MRISSFSRVLVVVSVLASGPFAVAQTAGDALVLRRPSSTTTQLLVVTPAGVVTSIYNAASTGVPDGMTVAPGNTGVAFVQIDATRQKHILNFTAGSGVTTVGTLPSTFTTVPDLRLDDGGDLLVLSASGASRGLHRTPFTGGAFSTVATLTGNGFLYAFEEDVATGDILIFDTARTIHRVKPNGSQTTVRYILPPALALAVTGNVHVDHATGLVYLHFANHFLTVDPNTGATTTIAGPTTTSRSTYYGLDADPYGGGFLEAVAQLSPTAANRLFRYVPSTTALTTVATLPSGLLSDVAVFGSRMLTPLTRPGRGTAYQLRAAMPSEPGATYLAAAAFGALSGIPLPDGRRIPLDPDPLFVLSQLAPSVFVRFAGTLDAGGRSLLTVNIPNAAVLLGLRFHLAIVTYDRNGIRVISEPLGVVVE